MGEVGEKHGGKRRRPSRLRNRTAAETSKPVKLPESPLPPKNPMKLAPVDEPFATSMYRVANQSEKAVQDSARFARNSGGAHRKYIYDDDQATSGSSNDLRGIPLLRRRDRLSIAACRSGRSGSRLIELDGGTGSIHRWCPSSGAEDFNGNDPKDLLPANWNRFARACRPMLISKEALETSWRGTDGQLYVIDKGQL
jgi:hypothetical protein